MPGMDVIASAFNGANAAFIADLYARWANDPASVDQSFADLFAAMNDEARGVLEDASGASWAPRDFSVGEAEPAKTKQPADGASEAQVRAIATDSLRALMMIRAYRVRGHLEANLDPLGLQKPGYHSELDPAAYGFKQPDFDRPIFIDGVLGRETATVREMMQIIRASYCGPIGVEFMHIQDPEQKTWIQRRFEGRALEQRVRRPQQAHYPRTTDGGGGLRGFLPETLRRHQALRP